jgi:hypothetical protein
VRPTARPTVRPVAMDVVSLSGTGSKTGPKAVLAGDYVFRDSITTKPGCHWRVYLDGFSTEPIDDVTTNTSGSSSSEFDEQGLDLREYAFRVIASKCGSWSVSLRRR